MLDGTHRTYVRCTHTPGLSLIAAVLAGGMAIPVQADVLAHWTFEVSAPPTLQGPVAGPFAAEAGVFADVSTVVSSHRDILTVNSGPTGNGSSRSMQSNWWLRGDAFLFYTESTGYDTLTFAFDQTRSGTGPASFTLGVSLNGVDFTDLATYEVGPVAWNSGVTQSASQFGPYSVHPLADNQQFVIFRLQANTNGIDTNGTSRIDNVFVSGTPVPALSSPVVVAVAFGGLGLTRFRRR